MKSSTLEKKSILDRYKTYRSKDVYLCRFYKKTGDILLSFVKTEQQAQEYIWWYSSDIGEDYLNINLTGNSVTKIYRNDIEKLEYENVTMLQRRLLNPLIAFITQPITKIIYLSKLIMLYLVTFVSVGTYHAIILNYAFTGEGSANTFSSILNISNSILIIISVLIAIYSISEGLIYTLYNDITFNYYTKKYKGGKTLINQLMLLISLPIFYKHIMIPLLTVIIELAQTQGYFLF